MMMIGLRANNTCLDVYANCENCMQAAFDGEETDRQDWWHPQVLLFFLHSWRYV